ncbi:Uncharacterized protein dnm_001750 [Desulfonema magnum]|uniref:Uncharacterized protein n=1 Tax=Desulfonema magnum TaxID=45655 RepID=A0A975BEY3_9BACT|nr:Uncharacterized protein dnm_001750 [Desulfonema magnum]
MGIYDAAECEEQCKNRKPIKSSSKFCQFHLISFDFKVLGTQKKHIIPTGSVKEWEGVRKWSR